MKYIIDLGVDYNTPPTIPSVLQALLKERGVLDHKKTRSGKIGLPAPRFLYNQVSVRHPPPSNLDARVHARLSRNRGLHTAVRRMIPVDSLQNADLAEPRGGRIFDRGRASTTTFCAALIIAIVSARLRARLVVDSPNSDVDTVHAYEHFAVNRNCVSNRLGKRPHDRHPKLRCGWNADTPQLDDDHIRVLRRETCRLRGTARP